MDEALVERTKNDVDRHDRGHNQKTFVAGRLLEDLGGAAIALKTSAGRRSAFQRRDLAVAVPRATP